jgi:hypothetical protein
MPLKEGSMKRSELYEKVWATPMTRLAAEFGISDVGLAKACRRYAVPAPPRGYWAKLRAGQKPPKTPLPTPELDVRVDFAMTDPQERARQKADEQKREEVVKAAAQKAVRVAHVSFAPDLEGAHPLVKATQRYCERIPKLVEQFKRKGLNGWSTTKPEDRPPHEERGRYRLLRRGLLDITASLDCMEWVLRFHATVFKGLTGGGMSIAFREAQPPERRGGPERGPAIEAKFRGETFTIKFSQGYRRIQLGAQEVAKLRKEQSWVSEYEFRPSEKLTFTISGSVYGTEKVWQGTQEKLEGLVDEIVRSAFELVPLQVELRRQREAAAERSQQAAEVRAAAERRASAKTEQLKQAFLMAETDARVRQLEEFLARLEAGTAHGSPRCQRAVSGIAARRAPKWMRTFIAPSGRSTSATSGRAACCGTGPAWTPRSPQLRKPWKTQFRIALSQATNI